MNWRDSELFQNQKKIFDELAARVEDLSADLKKYSYNKKTIINHLILAIHKFDEHVLGMIKDFPDYYEECKATIDPLLKSNKDFIIACEKNLQSLDKVAKNN